MGQPKHAVRVCGSIAPHIDCLTNTTVEPYHAYGLHRGSIGALMGPSVILAGVRAVANGHMQSAPTGDVMMLPGTFIVDREGRIQYAYYSAHAGDHPTMADLVAKGQQIATADSRS